MGKNSTAKALLKVRQRERIRHKTSLKKSGIESAPASELTAYPETGMQPLQDGRESKGRPRPITILALLLFLQAVGLLSFDLFFLDGLTILDSLMTGMPAEPVNTLARGLVFVLLGFLALLAGMGFLRLWRTAWVMAMLLQGLCLLTALVIYFNHKPAYGYMLMVYSILIVIYLNYSEVYATFQPASILEEEEEE